MTGTGDSLATILTASRTWGTDSEAGGVRTASTPSLRTGCSVTSAQSSGCATISSRPHRSRSARYSGSERPAWRMSHTGVRSTGSRLHARMKSGVRGPRELKAKPRSSWGISSSRAEQFRHLAEPPMDAREDGRVAHGRAPALSGSERPDELTESREIVRLVSDHKVLIVQAERVGQQLADLRVLVADLHVLVHHALPRFLVEQVPVGRLRERIDDQIPRSFAAEQRLLLRRWLLHVLRRLDQAEEALL